MQAPGQEKAWEALVQSQVRFNRVPEKVLEKVPEKVPGGFGAEPRRAVQSQVRFNRIPEKVAEGIGNFWCRARSQAISHGFPSVHPVVASISLPSNGALPKLFPTGSTGSPGFPALGFAAPFRKICKIKRRSC